MLGGEGRVVAGVLVGVALGGGCGAVLAKLLSDGSVRVSMGWAVALGATVVVLVWMLRTLTLAVDFPLPNRSEERPTGKVVDPLLAPWERRLAASARDRRLFIAALQPTLLDLARSRIRLHHAVDLDQILLDPVRARYILGDDLWFWLATTDHDGRPPRPSELHAIVAAVRAL